MERKKKKSSGQSVQFLFTLLLFLMLTICALFTISFGAKVYENIDKNMNENFIGTTALSYVSNKVRQADETDAVSVENIENTEALKIKQIFEGQKYITLIYFKDGHIRELFISEGSSFTLADGIDIMEADGLDFSMISGNLLKAETPGKNGASLILALRSEGDDDK